ncbi:MAG: Nicotinamidase/isochorismatase family protein [Gemmatimonadetes bacterium]|nr:Nicotinamidase/isochorismatase family protein [Gemmatimonadota bacterium]
MTERTLELDPKETALVLIDLQHGIVGMRLAPYTGAEVVERAARLAERFRQAGAPVVLVRVAFSPDNGDMHRPPADSLPPLFERPADWSELVPQIGPREGDIVVTKRQWGAFHGTDLDLQLRRRGIRTVVLGGIATNFGVESTARAAFEHAYALVLVEDAMSSVSAEAHAFAVGTIFPRLGRVRSTDEVLAALPPID